MNCNTSRYRAANGFLRKTGRCFLGVALLNGFGSLVYAQTEVHGPAQVQPEQNQAAVPSANGSAPATAPGFPAPPLAAKAPGVTRIGVVQPKVQFGQPTANLTLAEPLRSLISQYLNGPRFEVITVMAMLPAQVDEEARQKDCDYVLFSSLTEKMNSGGLGAWRKVMPLATMIPGVGAVAGIGTAIATTAAANAALSAANLSGAIKAKSEVTFEYQLVAFGQRPVFANSAKAKARNDGDDVITPLVTNADAAILAELSKKK